MAIFLPEGEEDRRFEELLRLARVLGLLDQCRRQEDGFGECRMTRWRKSSEEGSIYRTKKARAILTYLFTVSVKSEGVQVDMVTICTVIKGLCR